MRFHDHTQSKVVLQKFFSSNLQVTRVNSLTRFVGLQQVQQITRACSRAISKKKTANSFFIYLIGIQRYTWLEESHVLSQVLLANRDDFLQRNSNHYHYIYIYIIIIMSYLRHGYPWPSLATSPNRSSPLIDLQGHISYPHIAAECMFELVILLLQAICWGP